MVRMLQQDARRTYLGSVAVFYPRVCARNGMGAVINPQAIAA